MARSKASIAIYYMGLTMAMAIMLNLFPVYLARTLNFSADQIGIIMSTAGLIALFTTSFWGYVQDRWKNAPKLLALLAFGFLFANYFMIETKTFAIILIFKLISEFFRSGIFPTIDNFLFTFAHLKKFSASSIRLFGSLGYSLIILIVSFLIADDQIKIALDLTSIFLLISAIATFSMPKIHKIESAKSMNMLGSIKTLFRNKQFICYALYFAFLMGTSEAFFTFNGQHITQTLSAGTIAIGLSILFASGIEIPFFFMIDKIYQRFPIRNVFVFVAIINFCRWFLELQTTNIYFHIALMLLHGICFALSFQGIMVSIKRVTPNQIHGSAIALLGTFQGLVNFVITVISGYLITYSNTTYSIFYLYLFSACFVLFFAIVIRRFPERMLVRIE